MSLCTECKSDATRVLETRIDGRGWRWRRRVCKTCGCRFNTAEVPATELTIEEEATADDTADDH